ncbi:MAG: hypothetical protein EB103_05805 [Actinobacteria bacterium]|nr:hypothetical protein [Actinomycetota bacterium]
MRAERLPDLLNNLSGRNEAKVRVRFHNDEGHELEVIRRIKVKENGYTSTYILNGKVATLTEVHEELVKSETLTLELSLSVGDVAGEGVTVGDELPLGLVVKKAIH